ncbi:hypothetical protein N7509_002063 [Penicillium cosmopolitanum]|uniref:AMP-binding enzyme C-terminal domain-containing protein n=1 Tax=Penicillium cosmopolitanum TaxID=1131564 RepID=A0A9X0BD38_9EURO|nr:uncharacterized protein N7509_002063 [Penicillium cosmopolitanum]KAJ5408180.1 hypothetical protein N7509_002063 [Penicillium cosmopolitanum]
MGRLKDMIKKGGENIAPRDVEQVLELHPDILTAAVVGIPDIGSKDICIWLRTRLAAFKIPEHVFWIGDGTGVPDHLPVNSSGKILKQELSRIADHLKNATEP